MARPKTFDDDAVLDRALQLFRQRGYEGTRMADLEAHLRLGRQSLYNTFGDKQALYLKALERYQRQTSDTLRSVLDAPDAGLDALRRWLAMHTASLTAPGERAGCFVVNSVVERPQDTATVARCAGAREQLLNLVRATRVRAAVVLTRRLRRARAAEARTIRTCGRSTGWHMTSSRSANISLTIWP